VGAEGGERTSSRAYQEYDGVRTTKVTPTIVAAWCQGRGRFPAASSSAVRRHTSRAVAISSASADGVTTASAQ